MNVQWPTAHLLNDEFAQFNLSCLSLWQRLCCFFPILCSEHLRKSAFLCSWSGNNTSPRSGVVYPIPMLQISSECLNVLMNCFQNAAHQLNMNCFLGIGLEPGEKVFSLMHVALLGAFSNPMWKCNNGLKQHQRSPGCVCLSRLQLDHRHQHRPCCSGLPQCPLLCSCLLCSSVEQNQGDQWKWYVAAAASVYEEQLVNECVNLFLQGAASPCHHLDANFELGEPDHLHLDHGHWIRQRWSNADCLSLPSWGSCLGFPLGWSHDLVWQKGNWHASSTQPSLPTLSTSTLPAHHRSTTCLPSWLSSWTSLLFLEQEGMLCYRYLNNSFVVDCILPLSVL